MKVSELIEQLQKLNPDALVVLQKDSEGNGYSPLAGAEGAIYIAESSYSGDVLTPSWSAEAAGIDNEKEWESIKKDPSKQCVVFWPIN